MTDISRRQKMPPHQSQQQEADAGNGIPLIPGWAQMWGVLLAIPAVIALLLILQVGLVYGADDGWALLAAAAALIIAPWLFGYTRRREAGQARREQARYEQLKIEEVDVMTGRGFEGHCVKLLPARGYRNVIWTGGIKGGDQGGDITATAPDGTPVAVQCKRRKASIGPGVIRELVGAPRNGMRRHRQGGDPARNAHLR
jgi:Restriction endonuclease